MSTYFNTENLVEHSSSNFTEYKLKKPDIVIWKGELNRILVKVDCLTDENLFKTNVKENHLFINTPELLHFPKMNLYLHLNRLLLVKLLYTSKP